MLLSIFWRTWAKLLHLCSKYVCTDSSTWDTKLSNNKFESHQCLTSIQEKNMQNIVHNFRSYLGLFGIKYCHLCKTPPLIIFLIVLIEVLLRMVSRKLPLISWCCPSSQLWCFSSAFFQFPWWICRWWWVMAADTVQCRQSYSVGKSLCNCFLII